MSAVSVDPVFSQNKEYLNGLIKTIIMEDMELLKSSILKMLETDQEFRDYVSGMILTDQDILKRVGVLEEVTGHAEKYYLEEQEETISGRITKLEEKIEKLTETVKPELMNRDLVNCPQSVTDLRADFLIEHLETNELVPKADSGFVNVECRIIDNKEFHYFIDHVLPPEYRPKSKMNLRKLKKDIFENAEHRHGDKVSIDKSWHGRKELRLFMFKQIPLPTVTE